MMVPPAAELFAAHPDPFRGVVLERVAGIAVGRRYAGTCVGCM